MPRSWAAVGLFVVLAVVLAVGAALYWTGNLQALATGASGQVHHKHAAALGVVAVLALAAAVMARPQAKTA